MSYFAHARNVDAAHGSFNHVRGSQTNIQLTVNAAPGTYPPLLPGVLQGRELAAVLDPPGLRPRTHDAVDYAPVRKYVLVGERP